MRDFDQSWLCGVANDEVAGVVDHADVVCHRLYIGQGLYSIRSCMHVADAAAVLVLFLMRLLQHG